MSHSAPSPALPWFPPHLWLNGAWTPASGGEHLPVTNPANGTTLAQVAIATAQDFTHAADVAAARLAAWSRTSAQTRGEILKKVAALLLERKQQFATLLTLEQGKPLRQAEGEVDYAASFYQWFGEEARRLHGIITDHPGDQREFLIEKKPIGVVGVITPWNFPLAQGAKKVAAALAAGCTLVWKPSELTPLVALAMGPLFQEAGVPDSVVQILTARGEVAGPALAAHPKVAIISLTGSTATGTRVMRDCAPHIKRVSLELGGNAPFIVLPDSDLDLACRDLLALKTLTSGQVCVTANRVFVHAAIYEEFAERLRIGLSRLRMGDGLDPATDLGPLIHHQACANIGGLIQDALAHGAQCRFGQGDLPPPPEAQAGSFFTPVLLTGCTEACRLAHEEIFGPVLPLFAFETLEEVIERANNTPYGLAAYIYTQDYATGKYLAEHLEVGIIGVNEMRPLKAQIPFGGWKRSGIGVEGGVEGLQEFLETRVISLPKTFLHTP